MHVICFHVERPPSEGGRKGTSWEDGRAHGNGVDACSSGVQRRVSRVGVRTYMPTSARSRDPGPYPRTRYVLILVDMNSTTKMSTTRPTRIEPASFQR